jgi:heptosyltransferase-1
LASFFYGRTVCVSRSQHAIDRNRQLMAQALGYAVGNPSPDYGLQGLAERLPDPGIVLSDRSVMGLHATSRADKLWPLACWQTLATELGAKNLDLVLPWGNADEQARAHAIAQGHHNVKVLPKLGLDALASLIARSAVVVGVDTGLLHLAAALGRPGVALYTATPPALTGAVSDRRASGQLHNFSTPSELAVSSVLSTLEAALNSSLTS